MILTFSPENDSDENFSVEKISDTVFCVTDTNRAGWVVWPLRLGATIATLLLFNQAVFAGQFLSGTFASLQTHRDNATYAGVAVLITAACAVPLRRPGGGPIWPAFAFLGLFALIALQIALGFARTLTLHIPLGIMIIGLSGRLTLWSWSYRPGRAPRTDPTAAPPPAERPASVSVKSSGRRLSPISPHPATPDLPSDR